MPLKIALAMSAGAAEQVFPAARLSLMDAGLELLSEAPLTTFDSREARELLPQLDALITGWGCPLLTADVLERAPELRFALHAAGSVKHHITEAVWARGIQVSTAAAANAIPVAEYTLAMILLANKKVLESSAALCRGEGTRISPTTLFPGLGNYGKNIGLVGASQVGRALIKVLRPFEFNVLVADPFLTREEAAQLGVTLMELDELLEASDIVSVHAPSLPETHHLINKERLALIQPGATFINTSRGALVDQDALLQRIQEGTLYAVLDVTTPEVLEPGHPLYSEPNLTLTPHVAGALGVELARLGAAALDEAGRAARGEPLAFPVTRADWDRSA